MAWNEPGGNKDPWGGGGGQRPPDLDQIVQNLQKRLKSLFGGGSGQGPKQSFFTVGWVVPLLVIAWLLSGMYTVDSAERAVVLRFGAYEGTAMPGLHWHIPWPVESRYLVNVDKIQPYDHKASMLTRDENIVAVDMSVQYRVSDPAAFLFHVRDPRTTLGEVTDSAIREVVGEHDMDFVLGEHRSEIAAQTKSLIQQTLDHYKAGLDVTAVNLLNAAPPDEVRAAFDDVKKASEDAQRMQNNAHAYANRVLPQARGEAAQQIQAAEAYKAKVVATAKGDTSRFDQLLGQYSQAPAVTRERLYLETMEDVLGHTDKVLVAPSGSNNIIYLPLDKLLQRGQAGTGASAKPPRGTDDDADHPDNAADNGSGRDRGGR